MINYGMKLPATALRPLRQRFSCQYYDTSLQQLPRAISSSSTKNSVTTWELSGSSIIANRGVAKPTTTAAGTATKNPNSKELKALFVTSALPMVGFGFMDNFIMIQAGGLIDSTLGVKFGLATLTAAAMGQVVSDVSGVLFGSTVDNAITKLGFVKPPNMSIPQRQLPLSKRVSLAGAVVGVIIGCGLGATSLYFVPHHDHSEATQKMKKTKQILSDMLQDSAIDCDDCTVYLKEAEYEFCGESSGPLRTSPGKMKVHLQTMNTSESASYQQCLRDDSTTISTDREDCQLLCAPIFGNNGHLLGVIEFSMKRPFNSPGGSFGEREKLIAQITARHIGIVLDGC